MSERLRTIVEAMKIRPGDRILEIGCGHGLAATYICEKLKTGRLVAIDRSKKMIDAAIRRNRQYVDSGTAEFHHADVLNFDPGPIRFDKILAVRVALFHRGDAAAAARSHIKAWLTQTGKTCLIYDEPL